jgi:hypothetical protein
MGYLERLQLIKLSSKGYFVHRLEIGTQRFWGQKESGGTWDDYKQSRTSTFEACVCSYLRYYTILSQISCIWYFSFKFMQIWTLGFCLRVWRTEWSWKLRMRWQRERPKLRPKLRPTLQIIFIKPCKVWNEVVDILPSWSSFNFGSFLPQLKSSLQMRNWQLGLSSFVSKETQVLSKVPLR